MSLIRLLSLTIFLCWFLGAVQPMAARESLAAPPLGERWFKVAMGDERTGFVRTTVEAVPEGYRISTASSTRMVVLGFSRDAAAREVYLVNRDLSLKSFEVRQVIDRKKSVVTGEVTGKGIRVTVESGDGRRDKTLKVRQKVYPVPLLNVYPLMHGLLPGKKVGLRVFDPEEVKLKEVTVTAVGWEQLPGGPHALHLRNDLYPFVDNDVWVDRSGNTLKESVRDGLIVTSAEPADAARNFVLAAAIAKKDLVDDFSLIGTDKPVMRPAELRRLVVDLTGVPPLLPLVSGDGQCAVRREDGVVTYTVCRPSSPAGAAVPWLESTAVEPGILEVRELVELKNTIAGETRDPREVMAQLVRWVSAEVADNPDAELPPLETARTRKGNCQARVRLFSSLARTAGIPTRVVSGLVYAAGKGFIYHSWAECRVSEWIPVDPCSGQIPADVSHIKLVEGENPAETALLAGMVGRAGAKVIEQVY